MKLDLKLSESEQMLKKSVLDFVKANTPKLVVQALQETDTGCTPDLWQKVAGLGWLGIAIPEKYGGSGLPLASAGVLFEALGTAPVPGPYFTSSILGAQIMQAAGSEAHNQLILTGVVEGKTILSVAMTEPVYGWDPTGIRMAAVKKGGDYVLSGTKLFVMDAAAATHFIVVARTHADVDPANGLSLFLVDSASPGISVRRLGGYMAGRNFEVTFDSVRVPASAMLGEEGGGWQPLRSAIEHSIPVLCAYKVGGCQAVYDMTVAYTQQREQFGQKIGRFQYVAGLCIEIFNLLESARWTTYEALWKVDTSRDATASVHTAKAVTSDAYWQAVTLSHQVFSGISFSKEHELTFHLRASRSLFHYLGDPAYHRWQLGKVLVG